MSRRNSTSRRRSYGRRQHEVRERRERVLGEPLHWFGDMADGLDDPEPLEVSGPEMYGHQASDDRQRGRAAA
ncbi:MAG TPA: hypothetical protein VNT28_09445 [Candidatus Limnocylindrales bacterium]|jgi:ribosomal protein S8E|nr:hypothetical protein [Candidatus Limnocylindrales bacterium]